MEAATAANAIVRRWCTAMLGVADGGLTNGLGGEIPFH